MMQAIRRSRGNGRPIRAYTEHCRRSPSVHQEPCHEQNEKEQQGTEERSGAESQGKKGGQGCKETRARCRADSALSLTEVGRAPMSEQPAGYRSRATSPNKATLIFHSCEELIMASPVPLGAIHRDVGMADQGLGVFPVFREDADADGGANP